jgi:hypothetical protein
VKNTPYNLLAPTAEDYCWGKASLVDPQPAVPDHLTEVYKTGDYVLIRGQDIILTRGAKKGAKAKSVCFQADAQMVLASDWSDFDEDMTSKDLQDLGEVEFLLWWQNVQMPTSKASSSSGSKTKASSSSSSSSKKK